MGKIQSIPWLNSELNSIIINALVNKTAARPQPFSLWTPTPIGAANPHYPDKPVDYISWPSLVDRRFTARHLPPAPDGYVERLPPIDEVVDLYKRTAFTPSKTTSSLLCFFAQWFTDSVLRTNLFDRRMNTSNHEIDLCQIYGLDAETAAVLRTKKDGRLRTDAGGLYPPRLTDAAGNALPANSALPYLQPMQGLNTTLANIVLGTIGDRLSPQALLARKTALYATGLERGNSTIVYAAISTIFLREHNRICGELATLYPGRKNDDDWLFETGRNINIVMLLNLVINEYINQLANAPFRLSLQRNFAERTTWYRPNRIAIEFSLLYRWHSFLPEVLTVDKTQYSGDDYRFNNALLEQLGVEKVIAAASREPAGRIGMGNNPDFLWGAEKAAHQFSRDQRVRPFVEYQQAFGEKAGVKTFEELAGETQLAADLKRLYKGRIEDVEFLVGLFAEQHDDDVTLPGLLSTMVAVDAFSQILTNPLLCSNIYGEAALTTYGMDLVEKTTSLQQLVARNCAPGQENQVYARFAL